MRRVDLALRLRMTVRKQRLAWRESWRREPGAVWFLVWAVAFLAYLGIGLTPVAASEYEMVGTLEIPAIGIKSEVAEIQLVNGELATPETIVGEFARNGEKTLLVGHKTGVFAQLDEIRTGNEIFLAGKAYRVIGVETLKKDEIRMSRLLAGDEDELVLMTCAGEIFANGDATERLIVEAEEI